MFVPFAVGRLDFDVLLAAVPHGLARLRKWPGVVGPAGVASLSGGTPSVGVVRGTRSAETVGSVAGPVFAPPPASFVGHAEGYHTLGEKGITIPVNGRFFPFVHVARA